MVYAYVDMNISHPESFAKYREHAGTAIAKHGGSVLVVGKENQIIEGSTTAPGVAAILTFPDKASALSWISDPDLAEIHEMRKNSGEVSIVLIG